MILDERTEFVDSATITVAAGPVVENEGDVIDTTIQRDLGSGQPVYFVLQIETTLTQSAATTVSFILASDSTSTLSVDGTQTIHWESDSVAATAYTAGKQFVIPLPSGDVPTQVGSAPYERFLGVQVRNGTAVNTVTGGVISAFLTLDPRSVRTYADAVN